jgi:hypothetical protein
MGTAGALTLQLGGLSNASFSILPPGFNAGVHNAPNVQYVAFLSGLAHVTVPGKGTNTSVFVQGGANGIIFAADTAAVSSSGHTTVYPSGEDTRVLQIPTLGGAIPQHTVLHAGPCLACDL